MSCMFLSVQIFLKRTLNRKSRELASKKASKQASNQEASKQQTSKQQTSKQQASKQADKQAGKQASTWRAFNRSHALQGLANKNVVSSDVKFQQLIGIAGSKRTITFETRRSNLGSYCQTKLKERATQSKRKMLKIEKKILSINWQFHARQSLATPIYSVFKVWRSSSRSPCS